MGTYLTKGETFATGNTVTAAKLNNLVDNATVTAGSIGSTELANAAVTADKISTVSPEPVTTGTIRDGAVSNAKLADMPAQTVKVRATNSTGDASDLAAVGGSTNGSSKMLVGTSDSINAVEASQFKLVDSSNADAQDNTAAKLRLHTTAVSDWDTVAAAADVHDDDDRLLIYDADGVSASVASLKQIAPKKLLQSLPASTAATGVLRVASGAAVTDPFNATVVEDAFAPTQAINCPIFAKAVLEATTTLDGNDSTTGPLNINSVYNFGTQLTSGTLTSSTTYYIYKYASGDDFTNVGAASNATGVNFTATGTTPTTWSNGSIIIAAPLVASQGVINVVFSDALPHDRYMVMATANYDTSTGSTWKYQATFKAESKTTAGFTIKFGSYSAGQGELRTPRNLQIIVF